MFRTFAVEHYDVRQKRWIVVKSSEAGAIADEVAFQLIATVTINQDAKKAMVEQKSCFVLATNVNSTVPRVSHFRDFI